MARGRVAVHDRVLFASPLQHGLHHSSLPVLRTDVVPMCPEESSIICSHTHPIRNGRIDFAKKIAVIVYSINGSMKVQNTHEPVPLRNGGTIKGMV